MKKRTGLLAVALGGLVAAGIIAVAKDENKENKKED